MIDQSKKLTFGIIGGGMVGSALAQFLHKKGQLDFLYLRSSAKNAKFLQTGIPENLIINNFSNICKIPDCFILAVNDNEISNVVQTFESEYNVLLNDKFIFHLSGSKGTDLLTPLNKYNAKTFAAHPFQTFYFYNSEIFNNLIWGIETANTPLNEINSVISELNGKCYFLDNEIIAHKELYHLVAVAASNFLISTIEFSKLLFVESKLEEPRLVEQIIHLSVENSLKHFCDKNEFPLSGPLARGDSETITKHLNILSHKKDLQNIYKHFSLATLQLLHTKNIISKETFDLIHEQLS
ncbi:MAG: hypothetical protein A2X64_08185 [Ignavibacteria bacterium GWF2_33_9]|nr:MAG: hypothetical protein A2X64_08185 [Ignavibacteria bacterium GWF2_33_9]